MIFFLPKTQKASPGWDKGKGCFPTVGCWLWRSWRSATATDWSRAHCPHTVYTLHFALQTLHALSTHCVFALCIVQMSTILYALPTVHTLHTLWCWGQFLSSYISPLTHHSLFLRIGSDCALSNCLLQNNFVASISVEKNVQSKQPCSKHLTLQQCRVDNAEWHQKTKKKEETGNCN